MIRLIGLRLVGAVGLLASLGAATFVLLHALPGDIAEQLLTQQMDGAVPSPAAVAAFRAAHGFDDPLPIQFLRWAGNALSGELGTSFATGNPVGDEIALRLSSSLVLGAAGLAVALALSLPLGLWLALRPGSAADRLISGLAVVALSVPNYWLSLTFILVFSLMLGWLPAVGHGSAAHVVMPALVIGLSMAGLTTRFVRGCVLDVLGADYVRTARAKGCTDWRAACRHALPNALPPILTLVGLQAARLFDGIVVVETIFAWPGLGRLMVDGVLGRDIPVVQGCVLAIGAVAVAVHLAVDCCIAAVDPRLRAAI